MFLARTASSRVCLATIHFILVPCVERAVLSQSRGESFDIEGEHRGLIAETVWFVSREGSGKISRKGAKAQSNEVVHDFTCGDFHLWCCDPKGIGAFSPGVVAQRLPWVREGEPPRQP